tara:strand:- start:848 stop:1033 length:186 start_codon:yes stop_codon:yes gene_type:complete
MKYGLIIFAMFLLTTCSSNTKNSNDAQLKIDIYKNDMTYEEFKKKVIEYAEKATYPSLSNK